MNIQEEILLATNIWFWIIFNLFVLAMLAIDLGLFHRDAHVVSIREAAIWSIVWLLLALVFNYGVYLYAGSELALEFLGGFLLERSLSVDNIFVFILIFSYFGVADRYQHRVLFWGILTALVLRGVMILVGAALVQRFEFLLAIFGAFLVFTAIRMAQDDEISVETDNNPLVRLLRRFVPVTSEYHEDKFFVTKDARRMATPLLVVLLVIESSDVIFAVDSIPAIFGITQDPFIIYTSNIFAIFGLRALYFLLAGVIGKFHYLKIGLSIVLGFVGIKMLVESLSGYLLEHAIHVPIHWSLAFIGIVLLVSISASMLTDPKPTETMAVDKHDGNLTLEKQPTAEIID